jgi:hypothetical protein
MWIGAQSPQYIYDTVGLVALVRAAENIGLHRMYPTLGADFGDRSTRQGRI